MFVAVKNNRSNSLVVSFIHLRENNISIYDAIRISIAGVKSSAIHSFRYGREFSIETREIRKGTKTDRICLSSMFFW